MGSTDGRPHPLSSPITAGLPRMSQKQGCWETLRARRTFLLVLFFCFSLCLWPQMTFTKCTQWEWNLLVHMVPTFWCPDVKTISWRLNQPKCPSVDKVWCVYTVEYHLVIKVGILSSRATWIDGNGIQLSERVQELKINGMHAVRECACVYAHRGSVILKKKIQ